MGRSGFVCAILSLCVLPGCLSEGRDAGFQTSRNAVSELSRDMSDCSRYPARC